MSRGKFSIKLEETISPNLIPMIDIMFLLLLFLMLGADMGQRELEEVVLPKAENVGKDKDLERAEQRLTINIYHHYEQFVKCKVHEDSMSGKKGAVCRNINHWLIGIKGKDFTYYDPNPIRQEEKKRLLFGYVQKEGKLFFDADKKRSERKTQIRADGSAPYSLVQDVMMIAVSAGIYKIEFGAAQLIPEKKGKKLSEQGKGKQTEEKKIEITVPNDKGMLSNPVLDEVRVLMEWNEEDEKTTRKVGAKVCDTDEEILEKIVADYEELKRAGKSRKVQKNLKQNPKLKIPGKSQP